MIDVLASPYFGRSQEVRPIILEVVVLMSSLTAIGLALKSGDRYVRISKGVFFGMFLLVLIAPWWPWSHRGYVSHGDFIFAGREWAPLEVSLTGGTLLALWLAAFPRVRPAVPLCLTASWVMCIVSVVALMNIPHYADQVWSEVLDLPTTRTTTVADDAAIRFTWYWSIVCGAISAGAILLLDWWRRGWSERTRRAKHSRRFARPRMKTRSEGETDPTPTTTE